jgi:hypothetical protein
LKNTFVPLPNEEYEVDVVYPSFHDGNGFCYDLSCPCHENQDNVGAIGQAVQDGEVTVDEANNIYHGRTVR